MGNCSSESFKDVNDMEEVVNSCNPCDRLKEVIEKMKQNNILYLLFNFIIFQFPKIQIAN